jgi:predicted DNA-binding ribbon-helix-helix protein
MEALDDKGKGREHPSQNKLARLSISIPRDLYKQVKVMAHDKNTTISALIIEIIKLKLKNP